MTYRLFINDESTVLLRIWPDGEVEAATRSDPSAIWGPPVYLREQSVGATGSAPLARETRS